VQILRRIAFQRNCTALLTGSSGLGAARKNAGVTEFRAPDAAQSRSSPYKTAFPGVRRRDRCAGADVVQIDEPYMQARREEARAWGQRALTRALEGITGVTAVHIYFGYAAIIHTRPSGYSFLPELQQCSCHQISLETAQSKLDCSVLASLAGKTIMLGVIDLSDTKETDHQPAKRDPRKIMLP
jgi:hypothetical protein